MREHGFCFQQTGQTRGLTRGVSRKRTSHAPKGAAAKVALNPGGNAQGTTRRMSGGTAEYLTYELYKDTAHATVWGDTADTALDIPAAPNRNPRDFTVYGRVPAAQDATVGNYTDTVVATVNF
jgi:spore coat protein U-like protein